MFRVFFNDLINIDHLWMKLYRKYIIIVVRALYRGGEVYA